MEASGRRAGGHYAALGVPVGATQRAIELAFARWRERLDAGTVEPEVFRRAESAYQVLAVPASRAHHDRQLGLCPHPAWAGPEARTARWFTRRGVWHLSRGRPAAARALLERACTLAPGDPLVRSYLGLALARCGTDLHEAARHGEYAVARRPGEAGFLFNLAEIYAAAGLRGRELRTRATAWRTAATRVMRGPVRPV